MLCQSGVCQVSTVTAQLGDTCTADADCASLGTGAMCKLTTTTGNASYPGGYCTKRCQKASDCPGADAGASPCVTLPVAYGEGDSLCWEPCKQRNSVPGGCRDGYACYGVSSMGVPTGQGCWIYPLPAADAGPPSDKIGKPCVGFADCENPPDPHYAVCITATFKLPDGGTGGPTGFTGGYCTANCSTSPAICGDGGICFGGFPQSGDTTCAEKCTAPSTGQSDCRVGYVCAPFFLSQMDGGAVLATAGVCFPDCNEAGAGCGDAGYCDAGYCFASADGG
jgi:hypothetical protein